MTQAVYKTELDKKAIKDLIRLVNEYFPPTKNVYHIRDEFVWTKQTKTEYPEDFQRRLIKNTIKLKSYMPQFSYYQNC